ncbi:TPA: hypothetical protein HH296_17985 [Xanthomonas vasicola pv. zeae]|uniref:hypothetical protein n=1 Tax=Xanthomonas TaxID=338 RepID=UPI0002F804B7|nr:MULTISPECIES: hypothetical protein [Xanthomonas]HHZ24283.1 hypothetical protein [Xanthomonas vasicola pv. zeae]HHZ28495.1 hypothetical protein [Xanthomonas vasicola pv. zeae]HHZ52735.1 hypothetical protein [Xanthomonas vasicola pv. zeae]
MNATKDTIQKDAPFAVGDWVTENEEFTHPEIAKVRDVFWDDIAEEWVADLVLYSHTGSRIGRKSERHGGPAGFEPTVPCANGWQRIEKPDFPLNTDTSGYRDWKPYLEAVTSE